jgi:ribosomal protein S18 acetylase RimI-like enzyme
MNPPCNPHPIVQRRPAHDGDRPFLQQVYASSREREMEQVPWDEARKAAFLRQQFAAQARSYQQQFPGAEDTVLEHEGQPIGRVQLVRLPDGLLLLDLAVLPAWRGRGLGTAVVRDLMAAAAADGTALRVHVEDGNPVRRLYGRLGFRAIERHGIHELLQWDPP